MAFETEHKAILILIDVQKATEKISAALADIEAESPEIKSNLRIAKGMAAGLFQATIETYVACNKRRQAQRTDPQMTIMDAMQAARRSVPSITTEELGAVADAANVDGVTIPDLVKLLQEREPERGWNIGPVLQMTQAERDSAAAWARGDVGEEPSCVMRVILEDLRPAVFDEDLKTLLGWVRIIPPEDFTAWDDATRSEVAEWAAQAHREDRGEAAAVPDLPEVLVPAQDTFHFIVDRLLASGELPEDLLIDSSVDSGALLAIDAMVEAGLAERRNNAFVLVGELSSDDLPRLELIARNIGSRRAPLDGVNAGGIEFSALDLSDTSVAPILDSIEKIKAINDRLDVDAGEKESTAATIKLLDEAVRNTPDDFDETSEPSDSSWDDNEDPDDEDGGSYREQDGQEALFGDH